MANNHSETERRLWAAADEFRVNSELKSSEYATPVLGLIFLRYADFRFTQVEKELAGKGSGRRTIGKEDYQAKGVMYLPPIARYSHLLALPEGENIGKAINEAMKAVETENEELKGVLPKTYTKIDTVILASLLKNFSQVAVDAEGDKFGKIYECFLGNFARAEGQRGGQFFTPTTLVQLIVEVVEPHHGRIIDHSCGSGGMSVQSAKFIKSRLTASRRRPREKAFGGMNLHSTQPAIAGSSTFQAVHQFTEPTFNFRVFHFHGSILIRLAAFPQKCVFRFVVIQADRAAMFLIRRDTLLHQRTGVASLIRNRSLTSP